MTETVPASEQEAIASLILEELEDEMRLDRQVLLKK
jgi:hypothetical protein